MPDEDTQQGLVGLYAKSEVNRFWKVVGRVGKNHYLLRGNDLHNSNILCVFSCRELEGFVFAERESHMNGWGAVEEGVASDS